MNDDEFQFQSVRLKVTTWPTGKISRCISIPIGAVKRVASGVETLAQGAFQFQSVRLKEPSPALPSAVRKISIPIGAVKRICLLLHAILFELFQFQSVRLKVSCGKATNSKVEYFNSNRCG